MDGLLLLVSLLAGAAFVLTPCTLPVLPALLAVSSAAGRRRAAGIVLGLVLTFGLAALFLSELIDLLGLPADLQRLLAVGVLGLFGLVLVLPPLRTLFARAVQGVAARAPRLAGERTGFASGLLVGASLALVWAPCAGPIYVSIITASSLSGRTLLLMGAFCLGMTGPLTAIVLGGRRASDWLRRRLRGGEAVTVAMGAVLLATAAMVGFSLDTRLNRLIAEHVPISSTWLGGLERRTLERDRQDLPESVSPTREYLLAYGYPDRSDLSNLGPAPELVGLKRWYNTDGRALSLRDLRGKVVLLDFWTYSCINCLRTLPYLRRWHAEYADDGLVIIGIHAPEFDFERVPGNVERAIAELGVEYPVALDNDFATWRAYFNRYWPSKYLIDRSGNLRYVHYGEGAYGITESRIRELAGLASGGGREEEPSFRDRLGITPETYLGYDRARSFVGSPNGAEIGFVRDAAARYRAPARLMVHEWSYAGVWTVEGQRALAGADARLLLRFRARNVFLVLGPGRQAGGELLVELDGERRTLPVEEHRLYRLVQRKEQREALLTLTPSPGIEVYAFTFG